LKKINLVLGIHNHQPVGNFDFVFEEAYQKAYLPFLKVHEKHSKIKLAQHYTGILFEWLDKHHPDFVSRLVKLVKKGRVEMMTGGYYEPILTSIPDDDKVGQIQKLTGYVKEKTGFNPTGAWLAERVWEPQLPKSFVDAAIQYTVIDDAHFKYAGLQKNDLFGYYLTEHNGALLKIFPISEKLRYSMPFRPVEETFDYLHSLATEDGQRLIVFADDGEKFGVWPGTFTQCYKEGWLDSFFATLEENLDWINLITFEQALQQLQPLGRVYLPTASYREMMEWALPVPAIEKLENFEQWLEQNHAAPENKVFVRGGFWRNFLAKYAESNNLHKRMLYAANRFKKLATNKKAIGEEIRNHIYAAQCNCPYWHGVFGGLYLPHLRNAIYLNLIQADAKMDELEKSKSEQKAGWLASETFDFDADGSDEVIIKSDQMNLFISPRLGGSLFELDYKPKNLNILDTMTRRKEGYHHKLTKVKEKNTQSDGVASIHDIVLSKEEGLENYLNYDWYRRSSLLDHFLHAGTSLEYFAKANYGEQGDFVNQPYQYKVLKKAGSLNVTLERKGHVWVESRFVPIQVKKIIGITPQSGKMDIKYTITNMDDQPVDLWFGTEFAFSLLAGDAPDRYYSAPKVELKDRKLASTGSVQDSRQIFLTDEWMGIKIGLQSSKKAVFWRFPIETISMSEEGFERVYQCSVVMPNWKFNLEPGAKFRVNLTQEIRLL